MFKVTSVTPNKIDLPFLTETFIPNIPNTPEPFVKNTRPVILQENPANHVSSDNPQDKCFKPSSYPFLFSIAFINMENETVSHHQNASSPSAHRYTLHKGKPM